MQLSAEEKAELAEVYEKAANYLETYGWVQHDIGENGEARCLAGALDSVCDNTRFRVTAMAWIGKVLEVEEKHASCNCGMVLWNDDLDRTVDEVINTLHALANKLR